MHDNMLVGQHPAPQQPNSPKNPTKSIGSKQTLIPGHVTKILYREGEGQGAKAGARVDTYYSCYTIDGRQLTHRKTYRQFSLGLGRLIKGLEVGLLGARKNEKFVLIVSPHYGYQHLDIQLFVPKGEKLVFQFQIIGVDYVNFANRCEADALILIRQIYEEIDDLMGKNKFDDAYKIIEDLGAKIDSFRYPKAQIKLQHRIIKSYLLHRLQRNQQALKQLQSIAKSEQQNPHLLILLAKIYKTLDDYSNCEVYLKKCYGLYGQDQRVRDLYVQFCDEIGDYDEETRENLKEIRRINRKQTSMKKGL